MKSHIKSIEKEEAKTKKEEGETNSKNEARTIFIGDDTGLLKKVKMSMKIEEDIIAAA